MDRLCDQLLPGTRLAGEQDGRLHGRDLLHSPQDCTERRALTDDALSAALLVELLLKVGILHLEAVAVALQLAEELCALDGHRRLIGENPQ